MLLGYLLVASFLDGLVRIVGVPVLRLLRGHQLPLNAFRQRGDLARPVVVVGSELFLRLSEGLRVLRSGDL